MGPGFLFRLIHQEFWEQLPEYSSPEMQRYPLEKVVLQVKLLNLGSPAEVLGKAIQPPEVESIEKAIQSLVDAGALDAEERVTFIGRIFSSLPLDIKISRLMIYGHVFGYLYESIIIASLLSLRSVFSKPFRATLAVRKQ